MRPRPPSILAATSLAILACSITAPPPTDAGQDGQASVEKQTIGKTLDGAAVDRYTLTNVNGLQVTVMTYGATLTSVKTPDRHGTFVNVTLYLDSFQDYRSGHPLFGSVVGRFANRIAESRFKLGGLEYTLTANARPHHIHGGRLGFQKQLWQAKPLREPQSVGVALALVSPDGQEGYPGTVTVDMHYKLTNRDELVMEYLARTDQPTHINLTNHAYWNLAGAGSGDVLDHILKLNADRFLPTDQNKIPSGQLSSVKGTAMDFTIPQTIGSRIDQVPGGYDHCYVLNKDPGKRLGLAARVVEPNSGRVMEVFTTQPGLQLYTANGLSSRFGAGGVAYGPYHGLCLETQHFPDAPNQPQFPSTELRPGQTYREITIHRFRVQ